MQLLPQTPTRVSHTQTQADAGSMSRRINNQLPNNLPQLQNCIKRDPESYKDEFTLQLRHFEAVLDVTRTDPAACNKDYEDLVMFMAHVCHCYTTEMSDFPAKLVSLLQMYGPVLHPDVRLVNIQSCYRFLTMCSVSVDMQGTDSDPEQGPAVGVGPADVVLRAAAVPG